ncbi:hypothetical protein TorRG33x02_323840, partial [Trema orientale]
ASDKIRLHIFSLHPLSQIKSLLPFTHLTIPINKRIISNQIRDHISHRHFIEQVLCIPHSLLFTQPTKQNIINKHRKTDPPRLHVIHNLQSPFHVPQLNRSLNSLPIREPIGSNTRLNNIRKQLKHLIKLFHRHQSFKQHINRTQRRNRTISLHGAVQFHGFRYHFGLQTSRENQVQESGSHGGRSDREESENIRGRGEQRLGGHKRLD